MLPLAETSAATTGGLTVIGIASGAVGMYLLTPWWAHRGERAKAAEAKELADAARVDQARVDHIAAQAAIITSLQSTIATMQAAQGENHRDQVEQGRKIGKLESRIVGVERHNEELERQLGERVQERDEALANAAALQLVIDAKAREIARLLESNAELLLDLERVGTLLKASEDANGNLKAEVERLALELLSKAQQIAGLQQSVADLQHTLNPAVPAAPLGDCLQAAAAGDHL